MLLVPHSPQDAEAVARDGVWRALEDWQNTTRTTAQVHQDVDAALTAYAAAIEARVTERERVMTSDLQALYWELISEMENVTPNETRHQSALRLIRSAKQMLSGGPSAAMEAK